MKSKSFEHICIPNLWKTVVLSRFESVIIVSSLPLKNLEPIACVVTIVWHSRFPMSCQAVERPAAPPSSSSSPHLVPSATLG